MNLAKIVYDVIARYSARDKPQETKLPYWCMDDQERFNSIVEKKNIYKYNGRHKAELYGYYRYEERGGLLKRRNAPAVKTLNQRVFNDLQYLQLRSKDKMDITANNRFVPREDRCAHYASIRSDELYELDTEENVPFTRVVQTLDHCVRHGKKIDDIDMPSLSRRGKRLLRENY